MNFNINIKDKIKDFVLSDLFRDLEKNKPISKQKSSRYLEWLNLYLIDFVEEFIRQERLTEESFIKSLNSNFKTGGFELFLKKWFIGYFLKIFDLIYFSYNAPFGSPLSIELEDNTLNRFAVNKYILAFKIDLRIKWLNKKGCLLNILKAAISNLYILYLSLNRGLKLSFKLKKFKIMREAIWGLNRGYYYHDDCFIDEKIVSKNDLVFFSRDTPKDMGRLTAYQEIKESGYEHFILGKLPISLKLFLTRIIPKYCLGGSMSLFIFTTNKHFYLYSALWLAFVRSALLYEKVFSNYSIGAEVGHNFFSFSHIPEAIICQNYGTKYYLVQWSDHSVKLDKFLFAFLCCDKFLIWGKAHIHGTEGEPEIYLPTGYFFKRFIKQAQEGKSNILNQMGITPKEKIISFFDESFGNGTMMTERHFLNFWETALKTATLENNITIIIKPKRINAHENLSPEIKKRFLDVRQQLMNLGNVKIIEDVKRWPFIEILGVTDIAVSQGMTSSSTIAIVSGIEGLYFEQTGFINPFSRFLKNKIVFDDTDELITKIRKILYQSESVFDVIPSDLLKEFDAFDDDCGLDRLRSVLISGNTKIQSVVSKRKVGIIVQARMGSTRLPGKVIKIINGKPMLQILIERLKKMRLCDEIIIATTGNKNDDIIAKISRDLGVQVYRGEENDVLKRYYYAAKDNKLDVIVRVTSDCPLADPFLIDAMIQKFLSYDNVDYLSNTLKRTFPRGFDVEVFRFEALEKAFKYAHKQYQRKHVTPYIHEFLNCLDYTCDTDASSFRVTVDTAEDFELVSKIFADLNDIPLIRYRDVIRLLNKKPELVSINSGVTQKALSA